MRTTDIAAEASTFVDILEHRALHEPDRSGYIFLADRHRQELRLSYGELMRRARTIAVHIQDFAAPGDRVLLMYPSGLEFIVAFFACLYAGTVAVPLYSPRAKTLARIQAVATDSMAALALTTGVTEANVELLPGAVNNREPLRCLATEHIEPDRAEEWRYPEITGETLAVLQYSSGSTGDPNGVMLTHDNLLDNQRMIREAFGHTDQSVGVSWLPFYHDMGLVENVLHPLYVGGLTALMSPVDFLQRPIRWLEAISRYRATTSGGPNFAYELCVRRITSEQRASLDLSSWEVAFNAAEQVRKETLDEFTEAFEPYGFRRSAFQPCYGLAETTVFVSGGPRTARPSVLTVEAQALETDRIVLETDTARDGNTRSIVGCGRPGIRQDVVIVDPNSSTECPPARVGEIWVAGANVAKGYWNRDEKTQLTFGAHLADSGDGPYLRTGDLGFFRDGELFITGRLNDRIIIGGRNHYPTDIERTVEKSDPLVRPGCCAAFSVDIDGHEQLVVTAEVDGKYKRRGSHGSARPESSMPPATLDIDAMVMSIRRAVAEEHGLRAHSVVLLKRGTLPKTSSAKIKRYACRAGFLAGTLEKVGE